MTEYTPKHLKRWTMPRDYFGAVWPNYYGSGCGQSRDSDCLERSNFRCMLQALGGESDTVQIVRESHWAVGWVEWIAIHQDDAKALEIADKIKGKLADYPVVDEDDLSELECEEADEIWANCYNDAGRLAYIRKYREQFDFNDYADLIGCVRGRYFCGYASELVYR